MTDLFYKDCTFLDLLNFSSFYDSIIDDDKIINDKYYHLDENFNFNFSLDIEKMKLLSNFVCDIGFCDKESYYDRFHLSSIFLENADSFLNKLYFYNFEYLADIVNSTNSGFFICNSKNLILSELLNHKNLIYFENDEFIYLPDYSEFIDNDILHFLPNFIHKPSGFAVRFLKGIGRSSYCNFSITNDYLDKILYDCLLSVTI